MQVNFTTPHFVVPSQMKSASEFSSINSIGSSASNSMIFTLVIPFGFMIFMSVSMNRVWSMYLMF